MPSFRRASRSITTWYLVPTVATHFSLRIPKHYSSYYHRPLVAQTETANTLCAVGEDYEARSNCIVGAVRYFILYYGSDARAREFCESLDADLRGVCLRAGEEFYEEFEMD